MFKGPTVWKGITYAVLMVFAKGAVSIVIYAEYFLVQQRKHKLTTTNTQPANVGMNTTAENNMGINDLPHLPAMLIASAMVSRGEIGFLIASLSQSSGTLALQKSNGAPAASSSEEIFMVVVWAVVICTLAGPITVGIIVRRLKGKRENDALSDW